MRSTPEQTNGMIMCQLPFSITKAQSVVLSWNEGRRRSRTSDNCGTLVVDVYACPGFKIKKLGECVRPAHPDRCHHNLDITGPGYCEDWKYLPEGGYPPLKNPKADHLQECATRCTKAYGAGQKAFYINTKTKRCACSKTGCAVRSAPTAPFEAWAIVKVRNYQITIR